MAKFLIQCSYKQGNLIPIHDFGYAVINAVEYENWYFEEESEDSYILLSPDEEKLLDSFKGCIPVGSIEFVSKYIKTFYPNCNIKPINVPESLFWYVNRVIFNDSKDDYKDGIRDSINTNEKMFVKSNDIIKGFSGICNKKTNIPNGDYQVSSLVEIESEWRCFVHNKRIVDIRNYAGDCFRIPDMKLIEKIVKKYTDCPPSYTIDFAVLDNGKTELMEVHNFFSCGLYGFNDSITYLQMLKNGYKWQIKQ